MQASDQAFNSTGAASSSQSAANAVHPSFLTSPVDFGLNPANGTNGNFRKSHSMVFPRPDAPSFMSHSLTLGNLAMFANSEQFETDSVSSFMSDNLSDASGPSRSTSLTDLAQQLRDGTPGSKKVDGAWTEQEHHLFLVGIEKYGWGKWKEISQHLIPTRTRVQVATHGHKFLSRLKRLQQGRKPNRRGSAATVVGPLPPRGPGGGDSAALATALRAARASPVPTARDYSASQTPPMSSSPSFPFMVPPQFGGPSPFAVPGQPFPFGFMMPTTSATTNGQMPAGQSMPTFGVAQPMMMGFDPQQAAAYFMAAMAASQMPQFTPEQLQQIMVAQQMQAQQVLQQQQQPSTRPPATAMESPAPEPQQPPTAAIPQQNFPAATPTVAPKPPTAKRPSSVSFPSTMPPPPQTKPPQAPPFGGGGVGLAAFPSAAPGVLPSMPTHVPSLPRSNLSRAIVQDLQQNIQLVKEFEATSAARKRSKADIASKMIKEERQQHVPIFHQEMSMQQSPLQSTPQYSDPTSFSFTDFIAQQQPEIAVTPPSLSFSIPPSASMGDIGTGHSGLLSVGEGVGGGGGGDAFTRSYSAFEGLSAMSPSTAAPFEGVGRSMSMPAFSDPMAFSLTPTHFDADDFDQLFKEEAQPFDPESFFS